MSKSWAFCLFCVRGISFYWTLVLLSLLVDIGAEYHSRVPPLDIRVLQAVVTPLLTALAVAAIWTIRSNWPRYWCVILVAVQVLFSLFWPPWF